MKKLILFLILSLSLFSATTKVTTPKIQEIKLNETITVPDFCEFTIVNTNFSKIISPSNPDDYYTYYESKGSDATYLDIIINIKSLLEESQSFDEFVSLKLVYNNKYNYTFFQVYEEVDGSDFESDESIDPLRKGTIHNLSEIPLEIIDNNNSLYLVISAKDKEYKYIIR